MCSHAQRPNSSIWLATQLPININKHWQIHNDFGFRTLGITTTATFQHLYRTGIRYKFNKQLSAAIGAALFYTKTNYVKTNHEFGQENRLWQELQYQKNINKTWQIQTRLRTEERYFEKTTSKPSSNAFRYRLRAAITKQLNPNWSIQLADEYMKQYSKNTWAFNQNRTIVMAQYNINKLVQLQASYMWVLWPDGSQHVPVITLIKTFNIHGN